MSQQRTLSFATEQDAIREVQRLRAGCTQGGNWTLEQACWHLATPLALGSTEPHRLEPTESERAMQRRLDALIEARGMPTGLDAPPGTSPPQNVGADAIDAYINGLNALAANRRPHVAFGPFGPVTFAKFRDFNLIHAAHHLAFFKPTSATGATRRELRFNNEDEAIADIRRLRRGYVQTGAWTLAQICGHLEKTIQARMQPGPFPPNTPEQDARRPVFEQVMASGKLPSLVAPDAFQPPADAGDAAIDSCIAALERFKTFPGPIAPHRFFGQLDDADARKLNLIHVAHHLSHLVPST